MCVHCQVLTSAKNKKKQQKKKDVGFENCSDVSSSDRLADCRQKNRPGDFFGFVYRLTGMHDCDVVTSKWMKDLPFYILSWLHLSVCLEM